MRQSYETTPTQVSLEVGCDDTQSAFVQIDRAQLEGGVLTLDFSHPGGACAPTSPTSQVNQGHGLEAPTVSANYAAAVNGAQRYRVCLSDGVLESGEFIREIRLLREAQEEQCDDGIHHGSVAVDVGPAFFGIQSVFERTARLHWRE